MIQSIDYYAVAPALILALTAGLVLLLDAFLPRRPYVRTALGAVTPTAAIPKPPWSGSSRSYEMISLEHELSRP